MKSWMLSRSVPDPWRFGTDLGPRIRTFDWWILMPTRILLFSQWPSRCQPKIILSFYAYSFLKVHFHHSSTIKIHKEVRKQEKSRFFLIFSLVNGTIRTRTNKLRIRMQTLLSRRTEFHLQLLPSFSQTIRLFTEQIFCNASHRLTVELIWINAKRP